MSKPFVIQLVHHVLKTRHHFDDHRDPADHFFRMVHFLDRPKIQDDRDATHENKLQKEENSPQKTGDSLQGMRRG